MTLAETDARIRDLMLEIQTIKDQISAHDLNVQIKVHPPDVHWLNKARKAKRMKEAELIGLRHSRKDLIPKRKYDLRDHIIDILRPKFTEEEWNMIVSDAVEAASRSDQPRGHT